ncbi:MAG: type II secretion system protein E [Syntrophus sp. (in: bacteria)]|nr:type II secretion system protein E [Syntrophus sp. (in: bacteria)]
MNYDLILELMDGRREEADLARPFQPAENEIRVKLARNGNTQTFHFSIVCCVMMKPKASPKMFSSLEQPLEEVITMTGNRYHVAVLKDQQFPNGFYGLQPDLTHPYTLIFFTTRGVKSRQEDRPIGAILEDKGLVTPSSIDKVLKQQKILREKRLGDIISEQHHMQHQIIEDAIENAHKSGKVSHRMKVGDILVEAGLVTKAQVETALLSQDTDKRKKIGRLLIEEGLITEDQLLKALAVKFRMPFIDLNTMVPTKEALACLSADIVHRLQVLPLEDDGKRIVVATSEPTDYSIPDSLRFYIKRRIELVVTTAAQIREAILKYYPKEEHHLEEIISNLSDDHLSVEEELEEAGINETDSQIVSLVNKILIEGYAKRASDIHFEPGQRGEPFQLRYRIDGICQVAHQIPTMFKRAIISRLKIMSNLDISERRKPQSGKIIILHQNNPIEYRVEVTPTIGGNEDAVLRILTAAKPMPLEEMALSEPNLKALKSILDQPNGFILCVGPTGSGKTTTLHSALKYLNTTEIKIWTVEDPVEITQAGLRQVQVHAKIGVNFHEVLRSFLRSDPDVIMIGEMRDAETAKTAIEACLTGHLVLSTLHTNTAPETVVRLIEMGMDPFTFADALLGILAQRLARRLCEKCKKPYHPDKQTYDELVQIYDAQWFQQHGGESYSPDLRLMKKVGCDICNGSGYRGRVAIHELFLSTEEIKKAIRHRANADELRLMALKDGMKTLIMDGIQKVFQGITDLEEILQVCRYERKG